MQNRYVGDFGDYGKLAILRALAPGYRLGVAWWLYPDEDHNGNGRHVGYLENTLKWRGFDPALFDGLKKIVASGQRSVRALEAADLLIDAAYYNNVIPIDGSPAERRNHRLHWFERLQKDLADCNLLFLDPDNGLEPAGYSTGTRAAAKSIALAELKSLSGRGRTLIVYHHQTRRKGGHIDELEYWALKLKKYGFRSVDAIRSRAFSVRAYFLLDATPELKARAEHLTKFWSPHLAWHPDLATSGGGAGPQARAC